MGPLIKFHIPAIDSNVVTKFHYVPVKTINMTIFNSNDKIIDGFLTIIKLLSNFQFLNILISPHFIN